MDVRLTLHIDEVNAILGVLGDLPTKSGAYPLLMKIKNQAETQVDDEPPKSDTEPV